MIGQTVLHYKILERIGSGGMGEVYKAHDLKLDRPVVLKFPHADLQQMNQVRERLIREAKTISALSHPNIVTIYEINEWKNRLFICMEYVDGKTLAELCRARQTPIAEALDIATQIIRAVNATHKKGILHRDIKPSNIMVTRDGLVKVLDFGLAKFVDGPALTGSRVFMGTPAYSAPEIIQGAPPDQRSEIFAIGVVLYELLSGRLPFSGGNPSALMYATLHNPPLSFREIGREVPGEFDALIMKALAKKPEDRYQNLDQILHELERIQRHLPVSAETETRTVEVVHEKPAATASDSARRAPGQELWPPTVKGPGPVDLDRLSQKLHSPKRRPGENPYLNRVMIRVPEDFYGRKSEIQRIYARIAAAARPQSISVVGERRIGKSSLLHYLYHPKNRKKYLADPEHCAFAFIDFQEEPLTSLTEFFKTIYNALMQEYLGEFKIALSPDYQGFRSLVRAFDAQGMRMIILFDEFEKVTSNPLFDPEFFAFFRSMANKYNIAYVVTTAKDLQSLCHSKAIATSPFFNIFSNLNLGAFKPEEAHELICGPAAAAGYALEPFVDDILPLAGLFPFYLQIACSVFFELAKDGRKRDAAMLREAKRQFLEEAGVHFRNTWEKFSSEEQKLVAGIITGKKPHEAQSYLVNKLIKESYLAEKNNQLALFSAAFAEYLRENLGVSTVWKKLRFWQRKKF
jgi:serine/threonine-protein kinase